MLDADESSDVSMTTPDWQRCEDIVRAHGRTFYFASRCLPRAQRRAVVATYAFCRIADDIVDTVDATGRGLALDSLEAWERQVEHPQHPVAVAFANARRQFGIPVNPVYDLLAGVRMDLDTHRYATWDALRTYCYHVAGTVGLMVAPVLGCRAETALSHAADLGIAMQLTNILRDVGEDALLGRIYLPLDEIRAFGCTEEAIIVGQPEPGFRALMEFQIARARSLYANAQQGIPALDSYGRFTTLVASDLYARILQEIEGNRYDVFGQRAHCSTRRKILALPGISARFVRTSFRSEPAASLRTEQSPGRITTELSDSTPERRSYG